MNRIPLAKAPLAMAEAGINQILKYDPSTLQKIQALEGRLLHLNCTAPAFALFIKFTSQGIQFCAEPAAKSDIRIIGTASELMRLIASEDKTQPFGIGDLQIQGDIDLGKELMDILRKLDIDWEAKLAEWLGDIAAHELGNQLRALFHWTVNATQSMQLNMAEYLQEESRALPPRAELEQYYRGIEELAIATDRLTARTAKVAARIVQAQALKH